MSITNGNGHRPKPNNVHGGELQRCRPAFGARLQRLHVTVCQTEPVDVVEVQAGLMGGETQVSSAELDQLTPDP